MGYEMLVLDLDGTLTNSKKEITKPTLEAIIEIQEQGKKVVLASGRPTRGVLPLAMQLHLADYGSYILSFNGARITDCKTKKLIYNKTLPSDVIRPAYELSSNYAHKGLDLITYTDDTILSGFSPNEYTELEARINQMEIIQKEDWPSHITFPVNKLLATGPADVIQELKDNLSARFRSYLNIYCSEPFFLEIMPQNIDKANSLQRLLNSIGLTSNEMICCGDGYNDITMIESAGLGVAMANAQPLVLERADYITKSNDENGVLHVIREFMQ